PYADISFEALNLYLNHLVLSQIHLVHLSDGHCNCSNAEARVLMSITGHGPNSRVGGSHYHRQRVNPTHYFTHQESDTPLTYPAASHPLTRGAPSEASST
ncbi:hypothetical protein AVEN_265671-1, partial [Araneus ventricosus]